VEIYPHSRNRCSKCAFSGGFTRARKRQTTYLHSYLATKRKGTVRTTTALGRRINTSKGRQAINPISASSNSTNPTSYQTLQNKACPAKTTK